MIETAFVAVFLSIFVATAFVVLLGLAGKITIPDRYDQHFGKLVYALLGEVAIAVVAAFSSFSLGDAPVQIDQLFSLPTSTWIPVNRESGLPVDLTVRTSRDTAFFAAQPYRFGANLSLIPDGDRVGRYEVVHREQPASRLGVVDLRDDGILARIEAKLESMTIRRVHVDEPFRDAGLPFGIALYMEGEAMRFRLTEADTVVVDRAANKELSRILSVDGQGYLVAVVLSVPLGTVDASGTQSERPFAEFAIARLSAEWAERS